MNKAISFIKTHKTFLIFLSIIFLIVLVIDIFYHNSLAGKDIDIIYSDGKGYYAYLPALFIYHDLHFDKIPNLNMIDFSMLPNGQFMNKYAIGVSILQFPFFIITHILFRGDGFSFPYQFAIGLSGFFYWALGIFITYLIINFKFDKKVAIITSFIFILSTNFLQLAIQYVSLGHLYSFSMIALFVFLVLNEEKFKNKYIYCFILGLLSGIIFLIKSINIFILIIYFLYKVTNYQTFKNRIKEIIYYPKIMCNILGLSIPLSLQIVYWYKVTGHFIINPYSYSNEGFLYIFNPKILAVLFGPTKGLFFYLPVLLIIFLGFKTFKKYYKDIFLGCTFFLIITTYLIASWWGGWAQGESFSSRMHADYYSILMIIFSCSVDCILKNKKYIKIFSIYIVFCFIYTNFMLLMYLMRVLPTETGLDSIKDIFSFRYVKSSFFTRVEKINNKTYFLYEAYDYGVPYMNYPKGSYNIRIEGKNLLDGNYNLWTEPDSIKNLFVNKKSDNIVQLSFDINEKTSYVGVPSVPENKKISLDNIWIEKVPFEYNKNSNITEAVLPAPGEYIIKIRTQNPNKVGIEVVLNNKNIENIKKEIKEDEILFKIKTKNYDSKLILTVEDNNATIDIKEIDSINVLMRFEKWNKIYTKSNPYDKYMI